MLGGNSSPPTNVHPAFTGLSMAKRSYIGRVRCNQSAVRYGMPIESTVIKNFSLVACSTIRCWWRRLCRCDYSCGLFAAFS